MTNKIGFSTGCLFQSHSIDDAVRLYHKIGADAIEISLATPKDLEEFMPSKSLVHMIKEFSFVSIHAPFKSIRYDKGDDASLTYINLIDLYDTLGAQAVVIHPSTVDDQGIYDAELMAVCVENMDSRKTVGISAAEMQAIHEKHDCMFVLDLQHAYEHDPAMQLAIDLWSVMGAQLSHIHASGQQPPFWHVPIYMSDNKEAISKSLKDIREMEPHCPIILEGLIESQDDAKAELEYVRRLFF